MDPVIVVLLVVLGMASVVVRSIRPRCRGRQPDLPDLMSGLFSGPREPSWPIGVQEEDTIRPWTAPAPAEPVGAGDGSGARGASGRDPTAGAVEAILEDQDEHSRSPGSTAQPDLRG